jgi:hypothetical protein
MSIIFSTIFSYQNSIWKPTIRIYPEKTNYYQAQIWAKNNTPLNAHFITPPYAWGMYDPEWRVFSERSTIVVLSDTLEMAFNPSYSPIWKGRFNDIIPNALSKFTFNYFENNKLVRDIYLSLSPERISFLGEKYKVDYFVTENIVTYPFPIVYKNTGYSIYSLNARGVKPVRYDVFRTPTPSHESNPR